MSRGRIVYKDREVQCIQRPVFRALTEIEWRSLVREGFQKGQFWQTFKAGERGGLLGRAISIQKDTQWKKQVVCRDKANIHWTRAESQYQSGEQ